MYWVCLCGGFISILMGCNFSSNSVKLTICQLETHCSGRWCYWIVPGCVNDLFCVGKYCQFSIDLDRLLDKIFQLEIRFFNWFFKVLY